MSLAIRVTKDIDLQSGKETDKDWISEGGFLRASGCPRHVIYWLTLWAFSEEEGEMVQLPSSKAAKPRKL